MDDWLDINKYKRHGLPQVELTANHIDEFKKIIVNGRYVDKMTKKERKRALN